MKLLTLFLLSFLFFLGQCYSQADSLLALLEGPSSSPGHIDLIQKTFNQTYYQNPPQSLLIAQKTDSLAKAQGYHEKLDVTKLMLGIAYNINEQYDEAVEAFLEAVQYAEQLDNQRIQAQAFNGLAVVWQVRKDTETSTIYFEKALDVYTELKDTLWIGLVNLNLGGLYMEDELLDKADTYLVDAVAAMEEMNQPIYAGYGKLNLGSLRVKQKAYEEAIPYLTNALEVVPFQVNPLIHAVGNTALGEAYLRLGRISKSKNFLDIALEQSTQVKNYEQLEVVNGLLSEYYESIGSYEKSLSFYKAAAALKDSFISKEEDQRLIDALKKYEAEKQEQEIMLLSAENEYKDLRNERDRRNLIFALLGILAIGLIAGLILVNRNRFKKLSAQLEDQKSMISKNLEDKELLLREIHHRVKNNLQVISSLLSLQSNYVKDDSAAEALGHGRDRVRSMALIHQNLYQEGNLTGVNLKVYFEKLAKSLFESYAVDPEKVEMDLDIQDIELIVDQVIPIGLIANELISNSLKHGLAEGGKLHVSLVRKEGKVHLVVKDDGKGVNPELLSGASQTFGYKMIHAFKEKLEAQLEISSENGLSVELSFIPDRKHIV